MSNNILIVDDSKAVHAFLTICLKKVDCTLTHVYNGQEAVDLLTSTGQTFDLIMLDWEMPVLTGPETFQKFKEMQIQTPVLMMTTKNNPEDIVQMVSAGVREYMLKPFTMDILMEKIEFCLEREVARVA